MKFQKIFTPRLMGAFLIFVVIFVTIRFMMMRQVDEFASVSDQEIPKIIWTYWDTTELPEFIKICQMNWKKFAPNYQVNFIHQDQVEKLVDMPQNWKNLPNFRQADVLRLKLLEKYGGIWMDASILLLTNPDNFVKQDLTLFIVPSKSFDNPVHENWFIAARKGHPLIIEWVKEVAIAMTNVDKYINESKKEDVEAVGAVGYLICHLAIRNIYQRNKKLFVGGAYYTSHDTAFYEHIKVGWDKTYAIFDQPNFKIDPYRLMIKIRGGDRHYLNPAKVPKELYQT